MKKYKLIWMALMITLLVFCFYYKTRKEKIYILHSKEDKYRYQYLDVNHKYFDSLKVSNIRQIEIREKGLNFERWLMDIDQTNISRMELRPLTFGSLLISSPDLITMNFQGWGRNNIINFKFYVVEQRNDSIYILPVKSIQHGIE